MSKVKELLVDLRQVTEASVPNVKYNEQIRLIEELENELFSKPDEILVQEETPVLDETPVNPDVTEDTSETETDETPKKGRKTKQN